MKLSPTQLGSLDSFPTSTVRIASACTMLLGQIFSLQLLHTRYCAWRCCLPSDTSVIALWQQAPGGEPMEVGACVWYG